MTRTSTKLLFLSKHIVNIAFTKSAPTQIHIQRLFVRKTRIAVITRKSYITIFINTYGNAFFSQAEKRTIAVKRTVKNVHLLFIGKLCWFGKIRICHKIIIP
ncbi:MAG: hypothetical protein DRI89_03685 [Bacteroidetes bacterium]|nr:MAG: hypothetical protein DRI89_03685 [Bacteroidota bacterium]